MKAKDISESLKMAFWSGFIFHYALMSLVQDIIYGKEGYIELIEKEWVSAWWTIPLAIMCGLFGWWLLVHAETVLRRSRYENVKDGVNNDADTR